MTDSAFATGRDRRAVSRVSGESLGKELSAERRRPKGHLAETVGAEYRQLTTEVLRAYSTSPERYYSNGLWVSTDPSCWYCNVGPADGAALLASEEPAWLPVAVASFNRAIAEHRLPNGSFEGGSPAISSAAFMVMLGLAYVQLEPILEPSTLSLWRESLAGVANYLVAERDNTWYANGNVNCSYAATFYFAWRATGQQKYLEDYNAELEFLEHPPGHLWEGFGLVITEEPTLPDGSNGRGFLTEGGTPPGWDPEYSHLQLDFLAALYSASGDPRVLRLLNLILNQELTRVNPETFILNATGGTRKSDIFAFTSASLPLLVIDGKRPELAPLLPAFLARLTSEYQATFKYTQHNFYRGVGLWLAPILLATSGEASVVVPPPTSPTSPSSSAPTTSAPARRSPSAAPTAKHNPSSVSGGAAVPSVSPHALDASSVEQVSSLEIPNLEYAFASPITLERGVPVTGARDPRPAFAAFACTGVCGIEIRPLLVIHEGPSQGTTVVVQRELKPVRFSLRPGKVFVMRVPLPRGAVRAARKGRATFVRLQLALSTAGSALQGRSYYFKLA